MNKTIQIIKKFELELLKPEIRRDKARLNELLSEDFFEVASTGVILRKKDILKNLPKEEKIKWNVSNFNIREVSKDLILVTYIAKRKDLKNNKVISSLRSSLWKNKKGNWQIVFHQGTLLK